MIWRAKHFAILQMIPFMGLMAGFVLFQGIERWWAFGMAMMPAFSLYLIMRHYPDSDTVIIGDKPE